MRLGVAAFFGVLALAATSAGKERSDRSNAATVVHEWGTFTSVAGINGEAVPWTPLAGAPDLPCFVATLPTGNFPKRQMTARVRMETPVLYFYTPQRQTMSVRVDFPEGWITEWYPRATRATAGPMEYTAGGPQFKDGRIEWDVEALPGAQLTFPMSHGPSHYFAARETDAAPLRVGDEQEKMLFYRGVASFEPPVRPKFLANGRIEIRNTGGEPVPAVIVFENQNGRIGYRLARNVEGPIALDAPELNADAAQVQRLLAAELQALGLYEREALAMIETWRDSWFENGMRVFYLMPPAAVDRVLPLIITPAPAQVARVFVGRVEMLSPATRAAIEAAAKTKDAATLASYGRFLQPFAQRLKLENRDFLRLVDAEIQSGFSLNNPGFCVE